MQELEGNKGVLTAEYRRREARTVIQLYGSHTRTGRHLKDVQDQSYQRRNGIKHVRREMLVSHKMVAVGIVIIRRQGKVTAETREKASLSRR